MSDAYDSPWKGALDVYFQDFLALLFPEAHQGIDWEKDYKSLDTELQKLARDNKLGGRTVDKLVEVSRRDGGKAVETCPAKGTIRRRARQGGHRHAIRLY